MSMFPNEIRSAGWFGYDSPINERDLTHEEMSVIRDRIEGYLQGAWDNTPLYGIHLDLELYVTEGGEYDYARYRQQNRIVRIEDILLGSPTTSTHTSWRQS